MDRNIKNQDGALSVPKGPCANEAICLDMWLKIFQIFKLRDLMPLRKVCRTWNDIISQHVLSPRKEIICCLVHYTTNKFFRKEHISDCYYVQNYRQLMLPLKNHEGLHSLKVFNFLVGQWFLAFNFEKLTSVSFIDCTFTIGTNCLADHLKNLTRLEIINSEITDEHIRIIGLNMKHLEHLNVSFNNQVTGAHLNCLSESIKSLNLSHCLRLNDYKLCYSLQELITKSAHLETLNLKPLCTVNNLPFTSFFVVTTLENLKVLKLNCIPDLTLIENSTPVVETLEKLTLFGRHEANSDKYPLACDHFLRWLFSANKLESLRHLNLVEFSKKSTTDEGIIQCLYSCPGITHLKLNSLPFLTGKSLQYITQLKELKYLKFVNIDLSDKIVVAILKKCKHLRTLIIDFLDNGSAKPYNLSECVIHEAIRLCDAYPERCIQIRISKSLLPTHKLFTVPKNLTLEIIRSRFAVRERAIYVDEPIQM